MDATISGQIPDSLIFGQGNIDSSQFTGTMQAGKHQGIPAVVFDLGPTGSGNPGWRHHRAIESFSGKMTINDPRCKQRGIDTGNHIRASEKIKSTKITPDFCSPILYKIRQGASMVSYGLYVAIDATQNTGKKTSKMVDLIISEVAASQNK